MVVGRSNVSLAPWLGVDAHPHCHACCGPAGSAGSRRKFGLQLRYIPVVAIPVVSSSICWRMGWTLNLSPALFISILVFPASFAMNAAFARREQVLPAPPPPLPRVRALAPALRPEDALPSASGGLGCAPVVWSTRGCACHRRVHMAWECVLGEGCGTGTAGAAVGCAVADRTPGRGGKPGHCGAARGSTPPARHPCALRYSQALQLLASLKATSLCLYLSQQSWASTQPLLPDSYLADSAYLITTLFKSIRGYLMSATEVAIPPPPGMH